MQRLTREICGGRKGDFFVRCLGPRRLAGAAIRWIADQGMTEMGQMHADLMGAACLKPAFHKTGKGLFGIAEALDDAIARSCLFSLAAQHGHALAIKWAAADLALD